MTLKKILNHLNPLTRKFFVENTNTNTEQNKTIVDLKLFYLF